MKKHYLIVIAAAGLSLGLASCSQSEDVADGTSAKQTITFASGDETSTRTSMGGAYTDSQFPFYWEGGDAIYVNAVQSNGTTSVGISSAITGKVNGSTSFSKQSSAIFTGDVTALPSGGSYKVRYTGTGTYTSNNQRDATCSFKTTSNATTLVIPPVQTIATWAAGADTKRIGANGDFGTATATGSGNSYKFKLNHQAAYLIIMPRWGTGGKNTTYMLKSVTVTTANYSYLSGRFSFDDSGIGKTVTNTSGGRSIKVTTGGSNGLVLPTAKDQTKSINIAIKPVTTANPLYCIYEVYDTKTKNTYYIEKVIGTKAAGGTLTTNKSFAANTITPITADIKAGYDLANKDGYLDVITNKNPYSGYYEWDAPTGEEYFVSREMGDDYSTITSGVASKSCSKCPTYNQMTWYLKSGFWDAKKKWGPADNQKGGMWFMKKAYLISSGVVADESTFNNKIGYITVGVATEAPKDFNTSKYFFLPAAGCNGLYNFNIGVNGYYWLRTPYSEDKGKAFSLFFCNRAANVIGTASPSRDSGYNVWCVQ
jgi:hypothetical protein